MGGGEGEEEGWKEGRSVSEGETVLASLYCVQSWEMLDFVMLDGLVLLVVVMVEDSPPNNFPCKASNLVLVGLGRQLKVMIAMTVIRAWYVYVFIHLLFKKCFQYRPWHRDNIAFKARKKGSTLDLLHRSVISAENFIMYYLQGLSISDRLYMACLGIEGVGFLLW